MAIADWLNAPVLGNATLGDFGGAAVDFYDTYQGNEASKDALKTIVEGYDQGINQVRTDSDATKDIFGDVYDTNMGNIQPYMDAGTTALDQYMGLMQDPSTIAQDPAYQWRYDTGLESRKRDLEAAGYADPMGSGARATGINDWASGFASQELDRALARDLPIIQAGQTGVNQGIVAGDSYSRGMAQVNDTSSRVLADLYRGRADKQSTKMMLDSMAMTSYLKGAQGLLETVQSGQAPDLMSLINTALGGGTTSDGESLWGMLGEAFGFDPGDDGIVGSIMDAIGLGGGGDGGGAGDMWGSGGLDSILDEVVTTGGGWGTDSAIGTQVSSLLEGTPLAGINWAGLFGGGGSIAADTMLGTGAANQALTWGIGGLDAAMGGSAAAAQGLGTTTAALEGAAASGATSSAMASFMAGAGGTALVMLGPLAVGLAMTWNKDRRNSVDRGEDELEKSGNPVLAATGMYQNALMTGKPGEVERAREIMLDTINNGKNTTDVRNPYYADFAMNAVVDSMQGLRDFSKMIDSVYGGDDESRFLNQAFSGSDIMYFRNFANDAGKALRAVFGKGPAGKVKNQLELLIDMRASTNSKYDNWNYQDEVKKLHTLMNETLASKPEWNLGTWRDVMRRSEQNDQRVAQFRASGMSPEEFQQYTAQNQSQLSNLGAPA